MTQDDTITDADWDNLTRELCEIRNRRPRWRDAPTVPGLWVVQWGTEFRIIRYYADTLGKNRIAKRYYGPIPVDKEREG